MATYAAVGGIRASFTFRDGKGMSTEASFMVPDGITLAIADQYCANLGDAMAAASDAQLMGYSINKRVGASATATPVAGGRVEDKGLLAIRTAAGKTSFATIPAIKLATLQANQKDIDLTDPLITAITTLLITGNGSTAPVDSNAQDLAQILYGTLQQRKGLTG